MPEILGILGFYNTNKVRYKSEKSISWHLDFGGGVWLTSFYIAVVSTHYAFSSEQKTIYSVIRIIILTKQ